MTRENIKSMAAKSDIAMYAIGLKYDGLDATEGFFNRLEAFAKLVAKHERESCAELCECSHDYSKGNFNYHATLIRARGQA
jgi:hypothetical protein